MGVCQRVALVHGSRGGIGCDRRLLLGVPPHGGDPHRAVPIVVQVTHLEGHLLETRPVED